MCSPTSAKYRSIERKNIMLKRRHFFAWALLACGLFHQACSRDPEVLKRSYMAKGDRYAAQQKLKEAIVEYRNAVQQDAKFGEVRLKLANAYLKIGDAPDAYREFIRAADLLEGNAEAQISAGKMLLLARQFGDAKIRADKALAIDAKNVDALLLKGNALAGLKDMDAAIAEIESAVELDPTRSGLRTNLGAIQLAHGDAKSAGDQFAKAVEIDPKAIEPRLALANYYWSTRQLPQTEETLKAALALDPKNLSANRALSYFYNASGRSSEAEQYLKTVAEIAKDSPSRIALADYYAQTKRIDEAITVLRTVSASDARNAALAEVRIASLQYQTGHQKEAHATVDAAVKKDPKNPVGYVAKAEFLLREGKSAEALQQVQSAVAAQPKSLPALFALGRVQATRQEYDAAAKAYREVLQINPGLTVAQIELARVSLAGGHPDDALTFAQQVLTDYPNNPDAEYLQSQALLRKGDTTRAEEAAARVAASNPDSAIIQVQLGRTRAMKGDLKGARAAYDRAIALAPSSTEAVAGLVGLDIAAKQPAAALARVKDALAKRPNDSPLLLLAARVHATTGDLASAETLLKRALDADAGNLQAYGTLAELYARQNRLPEATKELEQFVARRPKDVGMQTAIGLLLEAQNKKDDARRQYELVLGIDRHAAVAANNLAWLYVSNGENLDMAMQLAKTAKAGLPDSAEIDDTLGWIYYKKDLIALAVPALVESAKKNPTNAVMQYHLGMAYAKAGEKEKARQSLQRAFSISSNFEGADEARRTLNSLAS